ncbi:hypothetical protein ACFL4G_02140 [Thermodesulfobacteriota bacterium]
MVHNDSLILAILILVPVFCFFTFFCLLMVLYVRRKIRLVEDRIVERINGLYSRLNNISTDFERIRLLEAKLGDIWSTLSSQDERLRMLHTRMDELATRGNPEEPR